jgi:hypothetical protein
MLQVNLDDVMAAGRVLFGPAFRADGQAWRVDLKTTYRRRALETHPDRARAVGRSETDLSIEFRRVTEAYRVLSQLAAGPLPPGAAPEPPRPAQPRPARARRAASSGTERSAPRPAARRRAEPAAQDATAATAATAAPEAKTAREEVPGHRVRYSVHPEQLPHRKLRFAEYLYYSGRVPWTVFVEALAWQRRQRPQVGRIAVEWGFLDPEDVARILEERRLRGAQSVPFGEFAVRLGYLTSFQLLAVLGRQLRLQRRIGEFLVEHGYIEEGEIDEIRRRILTHNARWRE